jgi:flavin-dependent dehydrogenase
LADRLRERLSPEPLRGWQVEAPDGRAFAAEFGSDSNSCPLEGWAVRRRDFDAALLGEALRSGARVRFGLRVFDVLREDGRVIGLLGREGTVTREIRGRFVVGAGGLRSVLQRRLGLTARRARLRKIALVGHLAGGNGNAGVGELRVHGSRTCGYARLGAGANVTLVVPEQEARGVAGWPREFLLAALREFPEVKARADRWGMEDPVMVTGPFDVPANRLWVPGALLVGDAAGYYDPFTGQGIHQALWTGRQAAEAIVQALADPRGGGSALYRYEQRVRLQLVPKRTLQRVIEAAIGRPALMSRFVRALAGADEAAGRLLRATGDVSHPLTLLSPGIWARVVPEMVRYGG